MGAEIRDDRRFSANVRDTGVDDRKLVGVPGLV
jgi:hypothetical protein